MGNRILKESICTSQEIDELTPEEECTFYRVIVNCDDYGRMEAEPKILRAKLYPNRIDQISDQRMEEMIRSLATPRGDGAEPLIFLYQANNRRYLQMTKWEEHQRIRAKRSKHPDPATGTIEKIGGQATATRGQVTAKPKEPDPETKEPKPKFEPDAIEMTLAELLKAGILRNNPGAKTPDDLQVWALDFDRMMRLDGRSYDQITAVIHFSQTDAFWQANILSAKKLREKYDTLVLQAKTKGGGKEPRAWGDIRDWLKESETGNG